MKTLSIIALVIWIVGCGSSATSVQSPSPDSQVSNPSISAEAKFLTQTLSPELDKNLAQFLNAIREYLSDGTRQMDQAVVEKIALSSQSQISQFKKDSQIDRSNFLLKIHDVDYEVKVTRYKGGIVFSIDRVSDMQALAAYHGSPQWRIDFKPSNFQADYKEASLDRGFVQKIRWNNEGKRAIPIRPLPLKLEEIYRQDPEREEKLAASARTDRVLVGIIDRGFDYNHPDIAFGLLPRTVPHLLELQKATMPWRESLEEINYNLSFTHFYDKIDALDAAKKKLIAQNDNSLETLMSEKDLASMIELLERAPKYKLQETVQKLWTQMEQFENGALGSTIETLRSSAFGWDFNVQDALPFNEVYKSNNPFGKYDEIAHGTPAAAAALQNHKNVSVFPVIANESERSDLFWKAEVFENLAHGDAKFFQSYKNYAAEEKTNLSQFIFCTGYNWEESINFIYSKGSRIISMSFVDPCYHSKAKWEKLLLKYSDVLFVVAAGNNGNNLDQAEDCITWPSCLAATYPNLLTVGASRNFEPYYVTSYSNFGKSIVHLMAPADLPERLEKALDGGMQGVLQGHGTSMSTPRVAGMAAEALFQNPKLTPADLLNLFRRAVRFEMEALKLQNLELWQKTAPDLENKFAFGGFITDETFRKFLAEQQKD
jgi:hypothetical protein